MLFRSFQPRLEIISSEKQIIHAHEETMQKSGRDERQYDLLFEDKLNFGFGHGCAISWDDDEVKEQKIGRISSDFVPIYEQKKITQKKIQSLDSCVDMKALSEVEDFTKYSQILSGLPIKYKEWIELNLEQKKSTIKDSEQAARQIQL